MTRTFALILILLSLGNLSFQQLPDIDDETEVDEFVEQVISVIRVKLRVDSLPEYARDDGNFIINELRDDLVGCKEELERFHKLEAFKDCVVEKMEDARTEVWEFQNSMDYNTSRSSSTAPRLILIATVAVGWLLNHF